MILETTAIAAPIAVGGLTRNPAVRDAVRLVKRAMRTAAALARDERIPKGWRIILAIACLPIPGPLDNAVQILAFAVLFVRYRGPLLEAWAQA